MEKWIVLGFVSLLITVIYSDFKWRTVSLLQLVSLSAGSIGIAFCNHSGWTIIEYTILNLFFISLQIGLVWIWFAVKYRRRVNVLQGFIGIGDWLFLASIASTLPSRSFIWYYTSGVVVTLTAVLAARIAQPSLFHTIPLAGCLAFWLIIWLFFSQ